VVASQQATRTVPIVFTLVSDPVGTGYVESLARPGGNMTGFTLFEYSTSAKYLEVLKEIAPGSPCCCARAASGHAAALPSRAINSRRLTSGMGSSSEPAAASLLHAKVAAEGIEGPWRRPEMF